MQHREVILAVSALLLLRCLVEANESERDESNLNTVLWTKHRRNLLSSETVLSENNGVSLSGIPTEAFTQNVAHSRVNRHLLSRSCPESCAKCAKTRHRKYYCTECKAGYRFSFGKKCIPNRDSASVNKNRTYHVADQSKENITASFVCLTVMTVVLFFCGMGAFLHSVYQRACITVAQDDVRDTPDIVYPTSDSISSIPSCTLTMFQDEKDIVIVHNPDEQVMVGLQK